MKIEKDLQFHGARVAAAAPVGRRAARSVLDQRANRLLAGLAEAGCSDTRARRAVVRALCSVSDRATPAELLARGRAVHPRLSAVTVYRTLDLLRSLGLVERLHHPDGCGAFVPAPAAHGHHVTCERCRRTVEFSGCAIEGLARSARAQTGFSVRNHWLELTGLCPDCRRSEGRAS